MSRDLKIAAVLLGCLGARAEGQDPPTVFLEKAYFSPATPRPMKPALLFEGQPAAHFFIFNQLGNAEWQKGNTRGRRRWRLTWPVSELFVVRMTDTISEPVLTPSYHIRPISLQAVRIHRKNPWDPGFSLLGIATGATHYSNGQHGCTYRGFVRNDATRVCEMRDTALALQKRTNTLDGDFSTTYIPLTVHYRRAALIEKASPLKWQMTLSGEYQHHLFGGLPGAMNREQAATYGRDQYSFTAELECRPRKDSWVNRIAAEYVHRRRWNGGTALDRGSVELSHVRDGWHGLGFFGRLSWGYDYYNIRYQDRHSFAAIGVMWDRNRLDSLANDSPDPNLRISETQAVDGCLRKFWKREPLAP